MTPDRNTPQRFAAPAKLDVDLPSEEDQDQNDDTEDSGELHELFEAWSRWSRTRRYYAPPPPAGTILGKMSGPPRSFKGAPDADCNMDLAALHLAILGQHRDALATRVFHAYYVERRKNIKCIADDLGIGKSHFYRLRKAFCTRVRAISQDIANVRRAERDALPHWTDKGE